MKINKLMKDWKEINDELSRAYGVRVPSYDLSPVLELLAGVDPKFISDTAAECIIMMTDSLMNGNAVSNKRTQDMMFTLKAIFRTFSKIDFDLKAFDNTLSEQIQNKEGYFANEPLTHYE